MNTYTVRANSMEQAMKWQAENGFDYYDFDYTKKWIMKM